MARFRGCSSSGQPCSEDSGGVVAWLRGLLHVGLDGLDDSRAALTTLGLEVARSSCCDPPLLPLDFGVEWRCFALAPVGLLMANGSSGFGHPSLE
mmetsp:Transcript_135657/g.234523  ORF Transcript_135657/g.234523 Transcript_135657/m.234523 type:complete len:95 (-) Transcript_135657:150-434(-)